MTDLPSLPTNLPLSSSHDPWLVSLSIVIAMAASYVALDLIGRVWRDGGPHRRWWLIGGATAMGAGIWSMHFIGMLAFQLPVPIRYDVRTVALSDAIQDLAHTLKSSSATLGAHRLAALAKELEETCRTDHGEQAERLIALIEVEHHNACVIFRQELTSSSKEAA